VFRGKRLFQTQYFIVPQKFIIFSIFGKNYLPVLTVLFIVQNYFRKRVHQRREQTATCTSSRTYCTNRTDNVCYAQARCGDTLLGSTCRFAGLVTVSFACGGTKKTESVGAYRDTVHGQRETEEILLHSTVCKSIFFALTQPFILF
jgi:hypothetical protein